VSCIYIEDEAADRTLYINPDECIDCGACEPECPVDAIFEGSALPPDWSEYAEVNAKWFEDKDAARARINELKPA
jgi:ferredoxin